MGVLLPCMRPPPPLLFSSTTLSAPAPPDLFECARASQVDHLESAPPPPPPPAVDATELREGGLVWPKGKSSVVQNNQGKIDKGIKPTMHDLL